MPKDRLEAFSDGVFAIAITLLVLELDVPHPAHGSLAHALAEQWPAYAAYVVSFLTIGIIWINHHAVMANLVAVDRTVLLLNLALLGWVSLIPWPTQLTAEYMRTGGADERTAALVYAGVMAAMGVTFGALWRYAHERPPLGGRQPDRRRDPAQLDPLPDRRPGVRGRDGGRPRQCAGQPGDHRRPRRLLPPAGRRRDRPPRRALTAMTSDDQEMLAWVVDRPGPIATRPLVAIRRPRPVPGPGEIRCPRPRRAVCAAPTSTSPRATSSRGVARCSRSRDRRRRRCGRGGRHPLRAGPARRDRLAAPHVRALPLVRSR